ncbi:MAG: hypothetical protein O3B01_19150 [Planctomycetota bacterium]|nr:hypothetical protein [Planctomycetota bacterium]MDA1140690.1 hypothetical protein [Planctomycetota bacterium]
MKTYKIEATVPSNGKLTITGLPFEVGHKVEVTVRDASSNGEHANTYPLRGMPIRYEEPFKPVADTDWEALK